MWITPWAMRLCLISLVCCWANVTMARTLPDWNSQAVIEKSPLDDKAYRALKLDNGLRVLLVSDPEAEKSAAALDVHVGSGHDPEDREGLAHYLEHMLFLGTEKYPEAGEYQKYIADHGGSKNAYTVISNTNYHFSIDPDYLMPALDRFAQFFISPTFTEKYVQRERAIVHSEYMARRKDESRRLWTARREAFNPAHPTTQFSVGNLTTLADRGDDLVRDDLIRFYQQYYVAQNMALTVLGRESLDQLQAQVTEIFAELHTEGLDSPEFSAQLIKDNTLPARLDLKPLIETRRATLAFPVDSVRPFYQSKPLSYIASILGHEGQGSILAELKQRGWAEGLTAGGGYMDKLQGMMEVSVKLTPSGMQHIEEVGAYLFSMIGQIERDGINEWRFKEEQQLSELDFRYQEAVDPYHLVRSLASRMQRLPAEDLLSGAYLLKQWAPERVRALLSQLKPNNLLLSIVDPAFESEQKTDWYEVEYRQSVIDQQWRETWALALAGKTQSPELVEQLQALSLPAPNPFVPENIELVTKAGQSSTLPTRLEESPLESAWHLTHTDFNLPKANFFFSVKSPVASDSPRHALLTELLVKAVNDRMNAYSYPAYQAGLNYRLYRHSRGLSVRISGYADKQATLLARILEELRGVSVSEDKFAQYKRELVRDLANRLKGRPSDIVVGALYDVLMTNSWSTLEQQAVIESLVPDDLNQHQQRLFKSLDLVALSVGNVTEDETRRRVAQLADAFSDAKPISVARPQLRQINDGSAVACPVSLEHPDAAFSLYLQGKHKTIKDLAAMHVLGALIEPRFYKQLRTENEVGYLVYATPFNVLDVPALLLSVQSNSHSVEDIGTLAGSFLAGFQQALSTMTDDEYLTTREGVLSQLREAPTNLNALAERYWSELDRVALSFDTRARLISAIEASSRSDLIDYYANLLAENKARRLLALSYGKHDQALPNGSGLEFKREASLSQAREEMKNYFPDALGG